MGMVPTSEGESAEPARSANAAPEDPLTGLSALSPERLELEQWLRAHAPALAPIYAACVRMTLDEDFPGRLCFVAHGMREIRNRLPDALAGEFRATRTDYPSLAGDVHNSWRNEGWPPDGSTPLDAQAEPAVSGPATFEVSQAFVEAVAALIAGHVAASESNRERARRMFDALGAGPAPPYLTRNWLRGAKWATAFAHVRYTPFDPEDERQVEAKFLDFEGVLLAIARRSYENMDELDEVLGRANS